VYRKVLLAYDGSIEGRRALREGAKFAQLCRAEVFLLAVVELAPIISPDAGLTIPIDEQRQITKPSLRKASSVLRRWAFLLPPGWKLEMPGKELQNSQKKSKHTLSSLVIARKGG
jgi:nucleotide-binding universal stress UspA family protein